MFGEFIGITKKGTILNDEICRHIMSLDIENIEDLDNIFIEDIEHIEKNLDIEKYEKIFAKKINQREKVQEDSLKEDLKTQKLQLKNKINTLKTEINILKQEKENTTNRIDSIKINKSLNLKEKELKKLEQDLFLDEIKLEEAYKNSIEKIKEKEKFDINFERLFILDVY